MRRREKRSIGLLATTRGLLVVTMMCAAATASCVYLYRVTMEKAGYGPYASFAEWPRGLRELVGGDEWLQRDVRPFGLGHFIDHRSIWRLEPGSPLYDRILERNELELTDRNHPKASLLIESLPSAWDELPWDRCNWRATPGYGTMHIEGVDLYLVVEDPETGNVIILHEWLF